MSPEPVKGAEASPRGPKLKERIGAYATAVRALHYAERRGDLAELRRMDPERPHGEAAFMRILVRAAPHAEGDESRRIALFVKILALATGVDALKDGRRNLGAAMHAAGVTEARVQTLMTAHGATLDDLLLRLARRLVRDGPLPYEDLGRLVLGGETSIENTRFSIARGYWTEEDRRDASEQPDPVHSGETEE